MPSGHLLFECDAIISGSEWNTGPKRATNAIHPSHPKTVNKKQSMISMQDVLRPEAFGSVDSWIKKGSWQRFLERKSLDSAWPKVDQGLTFDA